ncbi:MAG: phosphoribosylamine--glycine ligase [Bacillota bacterium]
MRILVVGGGGREHALIWKLRQSPRVKEVFCAPGNAGIAGLATCVEIGADDVAALLDFARREAVDLTMVGPEAPLVGGLVDTFTAAGLKAFGPSAAAAALEGSKVFAKDLMAKYGIPTARYKSFTGPGEALTYLKEVGAPCVVKADGLAAGKGVIVARDLDTARRAVKAIMVDREFGAAGDVLVIEECLVGEEASLLAFTDGKTVVPMVAAQDHKQIFDGDRGSNTGGMGAYAPAPVVTPQLWELVLEEVLKPTVSAMAREGRPYSGILYAGLMITAGGPRVLEFNVRFGDPEAQPLLMLLETDLVEIMEAIMEQRLDRIEINWKQGAAICVVMAAGGYPGSYAKGDVISGLDDLPAGATVFHAGTRLDNGKVVTAGGRVLGVTAAAPDIPSAINLAYSGVEKISFKGAQYRKDIGQKALKSKA